MENGAVLASAGLALSLASPVPLQRGEHGVWADFTLSAGQTATFVLERIPGEPPLACSKRDAQEEFEDTVEFWRRWLGKSNYRGRWREMVHQSALALKLLTFRPTGAIIAALPRACPRPSAARVTGITATWIRDAAFTLYALLSLGFTGRPRRSWAGSRHAREREEAPRRWARSRSCTESTAAPC